MRIALAVWAILLMAAICVTLSQFTSSVQANVNLTDANGNTAVALMFSGVR